MVFFWLFKVQLNIRRYLSLVDIYLTDDFDVWVSVYKCNKDIIKLISCDALIWDFGWVGLSAPRYMHHLHNHSQNMDDFGVSFVVGFELFLVKKEKTNCVECLNFEHDIYIVCKVKHVGMCVGSSVCICKQINVWHA